MAEASDIDHPLGDSSSSILSQASSTTETHADVREQLLGKLALW